MIAYTAGNDWTFRNGEFSPGLQVHVTDFDADGKADLLLYSATSGAFTQCINTGPATFN